MGHVSLKKMYIALYIERRSFSKIKLKPSKLPMPVFSENGYACVCHEWFHSFVNFEQKRNFQIKIISNSSR